MRDRIRHNLKKIPFLERYRHLEQYLLKAGIKKNPDEVFDLLIIGAVSIVVALTIYISYYLPKHELGNYLLYSLLILWTFGLVLVYLFVWVSFLFCLDYISFKRRQEVEENLPEYFRLVAANHRAGLPIERALWKSNRPRFGILYKEMETVEKTTYTKGDLVGALGELSMKYNSNLLKHALSNLMEGILAGTNVSDLLEDIATNITKYKNMRDDLASDVSSYMIFISMATLGIAPFMFGLSYQMMSTIQAIKGNLDVGGAASSGAMSSTINLSSGENETPFVEYFNLFVVLMIITNSIVSCLIMSVVKHGNLKEEMKKIPVFFIVSYLVYLASKRLLYSFLGNII